MKQLRHPNVIKYIDSYISENAVSAAVEVSSAATTTVAAAASSSVGDEDEASVTSASAESALLASTSTPGSGTHSPAAASVAVIPPVRILLATEHVVPLREVLPTLERGEIIYGLSQIAVRLAENKGLLLLY